VSTLPAVADARGLELVGHSDLGGKGDGMQVMRNGDVVYVGHMGDFGVGTSVVDVSDLRRPRVVAQLPAPKRAHAHKTQYADGLLLVNHERYPYDGTDPESTGVVVYDVSDAVRPKQIGFLRVEGSGVHRIWWTGGRYAYASARGRPGIHGASLITVDLADPEQPQLHAEWSFAEQRRTGTDPGIRASGRYPSCHHAIVRGDRAYAGWFDAGVVIFAIAERQRGVRVRVPAGAPKDIHLVDIKDERAPREIARFPVPEDRPTSGLRFGPHNLHENRPGTFQSDTIVYATYFSAGLRVYDTSDPLAVREIGRFVPDAPRGQAAIQLNDLLVDADGTVFVTDRHHGGLYILRQT
jgi:hypothetical protein